jgi:uncharacterized repeat protein (TIGR02543 family)
MKCLTIVLIVFALFGFMLGCSSEPKIHKVTFDTNGGSAVQSVNVTDGARIEKPNDPTKPGYSFKGWYRENTYHQEWNFSTDVVTADLTLYAKWDALTFTVEFDSQGGTPATPPPQEVTFDEPYGTLPVVTKAGNQSMGWTTEPNGQGTIIDASTICAQEGNHILYAKWEALPKYTVTFDPQEGTTPNPSSKDVYYTQAYGQLAETTKIGYSFMGWTTEPNGQGSIIEASTICMREEDHTLYAKWEAETYKVTFNAQGGSPPDPLTKDVVFNQEYGTLPEVTRAGYQFIGGTTKPNGQGSIIDASTICTQEGNHTLYAKWETLPKYTVTFDPQEGTTPNPSSKDVYYTQAYGQLAETTRAGYSFMGWTTEPNGQGSIIETSTICMREEDHTLYAKWEAMRYSVTLNPQGGTAPSPYSTISVYYGKPYGAFSKTTREGYRFFRWKDEDGNVVDELTICARAEDHTLYAEWGTPFPFEGEAGGKVFYENPYYERDGWRYLEAAPNGWSGSDTDPKVIFGYYRPQGGDAEKTGANGREIGAGLLNTQILVDKMGETAYISGHSSEPGTTNQYAARICLIHDGNYFSDWYLPSKEELGKLYTYANENDGYNEKGDYWSSTEGNASTAYKVNFDGGSHHILSKSDECYIRPIRKILTNTNP